MKKFLTLLILSLAIHIAISAQTLSNTQHAYITGISDAGVNAQTNYKFTKAGMVDPSVSINFQDGSSGKGFDAIIFPNPVSYDFTLQLPPGNSYNISMIDTKGKEVLNPTIVQNQVRVNCMDLQPGEYYVRITDNTGVVSKKIYKQ
jgi:hypothetical protein